MKKATPSLPSSSRMKAPAGGGMATKSMPKAKNTSMKKGSKGGAMAKKSSKGY